MITLRTATLDDLELIRRWDDEPHVIDSDPSTGDWDWARELQFFPTWREQLIAEHDVYRITRAEWLAANDRG